MDFVDRESELSLLSDIARRDSSQLVVLYGRRRIGIRVGDSEGLPFVPESVGRIWNKSAEIDVAAIDRGTSNVLVGECRWTGRKMGEGDLDRLVAKSDALPRIKGYKMHYALFSKSGFTSSLIRRAKKERVLLFCGATFEPT